MIEYFKGYLKDFWYIRILLCYKTGNYIVYENTGYFIFDNGTLIHKRSLMNLCIEYELDYIVLMESLYAKHCLEILDRPELWKKT